MQILEVQKWLECFCTENTVVLEVQRVDCNSPWNICKFQTHKLKIAK